MLWAKLSRERFKRLKNDCFSSEDTVLSASLSTSSDSLLVSALGTSASTVSAAGSADSVSTATSAIELSASAVTGA